jgi:hypothetical protein
LAEDDPLVEISLTSSVAGGAIFAKQKPIGGECFNNAVVTFYQKKEQAYENDAFLKRRNSTSQVAVAERCACRRNTART